MRCININISFYLFSTIPSGYGNIGGRAEHHSACKCHCTGCGKARTQAKDLPIEFPCKTCSQPQESAINLACSDVIVANNRIVLALAEVMKIVSNKSTTYPECYSENINTPLISVDTGAKQISCQLEVNKGGP